MQKKKKMNIKLKTFKREIPEVQICDMIKLLKSTIVSLEQKKSTIFMTKLFSPTCKSPRCCFRYYEDGDRHLPFVFCIVESHQVCPHNRYSIFFFSASPKSYTRFQQNVFSSGFQKTGTDKNPSETGIGLK